MSDAPHRIKEGWTGLRKGKRQRIQKAAEVERRMGRTEPGFALYKGRKDFFFCWSQVGVDEGNATEFKSSRMSAH